MRRTSGSIVFADEGFEPLATHEFAEAIKATDNYYVLFTREPLYELPYSVDEIYEIRTSGKYHTFQRLYQRSEDRLYALAADKLPAAHVLTEDSHARYQFYQHYYDGSSVACHSAGASSGIFPWLQKHHDEGVFVIADGAAFGSEMHRVMEILKLLEPHKSKGLEGSTVNLYTYISNHCDSLEYPEYRRKGYFV